MTDPVKQIADFAASLKAMLATLEGPTKGPDTLDRLQRVHAVQDAFYDLWPTFRGDVRRLEKVCDAAPQALAAARLELLKARVWDPLQPTLTIFDIEWPTSVVVRLGRFGYTTRCWATPFKSLDADHPARVLFGPDDFVDLENLGKSIILTDQPTNPTDSIWAVPRVLELTRMARDGEGVLRESREYQKRQRELEAEVQRANQPPTAEDRLASLEKQVASLLATTDAK